MFALTKTLLLASLALSASALTVGGHAARSPAHHHAVAARHAAPAVMNPVLMDKSLQRRLSRRVRRRTCRPPTSSAAPSTTPVPSSSVVVAPAPAPTAVTTTSSSATTSSSPTNTPTKDAPQPTTTTAEVPTTTTSAKPTEVPTTSSTPATEPTTTPTTTRQAPTTTSTPPPAPTTSSTPPPDTTTQQAPAPAPTSGNPTGEVFEGDATYFDTGLGACGITNNASDFIVAVSQAMFDSWPGYRGDNPNANPICKKMIRATFEGTSIDVMVTDRCTGCAFNDLDFTTGAFAALTKGKMDGRGKIHWRWLN